MVLVKLKSANGVTCSGFWATYRVRVVKYGPTVLSCYKGGGSKTNECRGGTVIKYPPAPLSSDIGNIGSPEVVMHGSSVFVQGVETYPRFRAVQM